MIVTTVVGNPKPQSRTFQAAALVAQRLTGAPADAAIDLVDIGADLLDWGSSTVAGAKATVLGSDLVIVSTLR